MLHLCLFGRLFITVGAASFLALAVFAMRNVASWATDNGGTIATKGAITPFASVDKFAFAILLVTFITLSRNHAFRTCQCTTTDQEVELGTAIAHGYITHATNIHIAASYTKSPTFLAVFDKTSGSILNTIHAENL